MINLYKYKDRIEKLEMSLKYKRILYVKLCFFFEKNLMKWLIFWKKLFIKLIYKSR